MTRIDQSLLGNPAQQNTPKSNGATGVAAEVSGVKSIVHTQASQAAGVQAHLNPQGTSANSGHDATSGAQKNPFLKLLSLRQLRESILASAPGRVTTADAAACPFELDYAKKWHSVHANAMTTGIPARRADTPMLLKLQANAERCRETIDFIVNAVSLTDDKKLELLEKFTRTGQPLTKGLPGFASSLRTSNIRIENLESFCAKVDFAIECRGFTEKEVEEQFEALTRGTVEIQPEATARQASAPAKTPRVSKPVIKQAPAPKLPIALPKPEPLPALPQAPVLEPSSAKAGGAKYSPEQIAKYVKEKLANSIKWMHRHFSVAYDKKHEAPAVNFLQRHVLANSGEVVKTKAPLNWSQEILISNANKCISDMELIVRDSSLTYAEKLAACEKMMATSGALTDNVAELTTVVNRGVDVESRVKTFCGWVSLVRAYFWVSPVEIQNALETLTFEPAAFNRLALTKFGEVDAEVFLKAYKDALPKAKIELDALATVCLDPEQSAQRQSTAFGKAVQLAMIFFGGPTFNWKSDALKAGALDATALDPTTFTPDTEIPESTIKAASAADVFAEIQVKFNQMAGVPPNEEKCAELLEKLADLEGQLLEELMVRATQEVEVLEATKVVPESGIADRLEMVSPHLAGRAQAMEDFPFAGLDSLPDELALDVNKSADIGVTAGEPSPFRTVFERFVTDLKMGSERLFAIFERLPIEHKILAGEVAAGYFEALDRIRSSKEPGARKKINTMRGTAKEWTAKIFYMRQGMIYAIPKWAEAKPQAGPVSEIAVSKDETPVDKWWERARPEENVRSNRRIQTLSATRFICRVSSGKEREALEAFLMLGAKDKEEINTKVVSYETTVDPEEKEVVHSELLALLKSKLGSLATFDLKTEAVSDSTGATGGQSPSVDNASAQTVQSSGSGPSSIVSDADSGFDGDDTMIGSSAPAPASLMIGRTALLGFLSSVQGLRRAEASAKIDPLPHETRNELEKMALAYRADPGPKRVELGMGIMTVLDSADFAELAKARENAVKVLEENPVAPSDPIAVPDVVPAAPIVATESTTVPEESVATSDVGSEALKGLKSAMVAKMDADVVASMPVSKITTAQASAGEKGILALVDAVRGPDETAHAAFAFLPSEIQDELDSMARTCFANPEDEGLLDETFRRFASRIREAMNASRPFPKESVAATDASGVPDAVPTTHGTSNDRIGSLMESQTKSDDELSGSSSIKAPSRLARKRRAPVSETKPYPAKRLILPPVKHGNTDPKFLDLAIKLTRALELAREKKAGERDKTFSMPQPTPGETLQSLLAQKGAITPSDIVIEIPEDTGSAITPSDVVIDIPEDTELPITSSDVVIDISEDTELPITSSDVVIDIPEDTSTDEAEPKPDAPSVGGATPIPRRRMSLEQAAPVQEAVATAAAPTRLITPLQPLSQAAVASAPSPAVESARKIKAWVEIGHGQWVRADHERAGEAAAFAEKPSVSLTSNLRKHSREADMLGRQQQRLRKSRPDFNRSTSDQAPLNPPAFSQKRPLAAAKAGVENGAQSTEVIQPRTVSRLIDFWENR